MRPESRKYEQHRKMGPPTYKTHPLPAYKNRYQSDVRQRPYPLQRPTAPMQRMAERPARSSTSRIVSKSFEKPKEDIEKTAVEETRKAVDLMDFDDDLDIKGLREEPTSEGHYELNPLMSRVLEKELQTIMIKVWQDLPDKPSTAAEKVVVNKLRTEAGDDLKNVLGLNVSKRLLNIHNPLYVKVSVSRKPDRVSLKEFVQAYNCVGLKYAPSASQQHYTFVAQFRHFADFDRICTTKVVRCGKERVSIIPCYKFTTCPPHLKTVYSDKNSQNLRNTEETQLEKDETAVIAVGDKADVKTVKGSPENVSVKTDAQKTETQKSEATKPVDKKIEENKVEPQAAKNNVNQVKKATITPTKTNEKPQPAKASPTTQQVAKKQPPTVTAGKPQSGTATPAKPQSGNATPAKLQSATATPAKSQAGNTTPAKPQQATATPAKPQAGNATSAKPQAGKATPAKPQSGTATPAKPQSGTATPAKPQAGNAAPAKPQSGTATPAKPQAGNVTAAKPQSGTATTAKPQSVTATPAKPQAGTATPAKPQSGTATPAKPQSGTATTAKPQSVTATPAKPQAGTATPAKPQSGTATPAKPQAGIATAAKPQSGTTTPAKPQSGTATPAKPQAGKATPAKPQSGTATPAKPQSGTATSAEPQSGTATPAKPQSGNASPAKPQPGNTTPAKPGQATPKTQGQKSPTKAPEKVQPQKPTPKTAKTPQKTCNNAKVVAKPNANKKPIAKTPQKRNAKKTSEEDLTAKINQMIAIDEVYDDDAPEKVDGDDDVLNDEDILAMMSGAVVLDECQGSDEE